MFNAMSNKLAMKEAVKHFYFPDKLVNLRQDILISSSTYNS